MNRNVKKEQHKSLLTIWKHRIGNKQYQLHNKTYCPIKHKTNITLWISKSYLKWWTLLVIWSNWTRRTFDTSRELSNSHIWANRNDPSIDWVWPFECDRVCSASCFFSRTHSSVSRSSLWLWERKSAWTIARWIPIWEIRINDWKKRH